MIKWWHFDIGIILFKMHICFENCVMIFSIFIFHFFVFFCLLSMCCWTRIHYFVFNESFSSPLSHNTMHYSHSFFTIPHSPYTSPHPNKHSSSVPKQHPNSSWLFKIKEIIIKSLFTWIFGQICVPTNE